MTDPRRYDEALEAFNRALEFDPQNLDALIGKGHVLFALGRYEDSLWMYDRAQELDPRNLDALRGKGHVLVRLGRYDDAISSFNLALEHNPANIEDWVTRGQILAQLGSIAEPEETFDWLQHDFMGFQGRRRDPDPVSLGFLIYAAVIASSSLVVAMANRRDTERYRAEDKLRERERDEGQIRMYLGRIDRTLNRLDESFRSLVSVFDQEEVIDAPFALGAAPILADEALMAELERLQDTYFAAGKELYTSLDELSARIGERMQRRAQQISQDLMELFEDSRTSRTVVRFILDIARILERLSTFIERVGEDYSYVSPSATIRQMTLNETISYLSEREERHPPS